MEGVNEKYLNRLDSLVDITVWSCFVLSGLGVFLKVWTKLDRETAALKRRFGKLQVDDYIMILALVRPPNL